MACGQVLGIGELIQDFVGSNRDTSYSIFVVVKVL